MTRARRLPPECLAATATAFLAACKAAGVAPPAFEVPPDGTIRILASGAAQTQAALERGNSCDAKWGARKAGAK
jgi:hypothetical protein